MKLKTVATYCLAFLATGAAIGGYYWYKNEKEKMFKATLEGLRVGKSFGIMVNQSSCLPALKEYYPKCSDLECQLSAVGFISGCMEASTKDSFCENVPLASSTKEALTWTKESCSKYQLGGKLCTRYVNKFISICTEQKTGIKRTKEEIFLDGVKRGVEESKEDN
ncbi:hypothetical protein [Zooshikella ganghwensis]|uniref:Uncharacterized protein n=1 Tax=Zooshikella ganghwensis TaxID=202772 RepID=A0A4P9VQD3_9GAMM|nr:hypothetical protein [Zooshikella ganghwensis]RDH44767.1 hypothetical protein B9G39_15735 [Zooshikella ganghwensis]